MPGTSHRRSPQIPILFFPFLFGKQDLGSLKGVAYLGSIVHSCNRLRYYVILNIACDINYRTNQFNVARWTINHKLFIHPHYHKQRKLVHGVALADELQLCTNVIKLHADMKFQ